MHLFGVVQAHRTSSNLLEPHHYRDRKVFRVLSHEFGVVRLYRTFSISIVTEIERCAVCLCTCSGCTGVQLAILSNLFEPHHYRDGKVCRVLSHEFGVVRLYRTFSIYIVTGATRYAGCCALVRGASNFSNHIITKIAVRGGSTVPNLLYLRRYRGNNVCRVMCTCSGWFKRIEPPRTFANHIITKTARCVEFCHMSSGWFDCTEPSLSSSLQGQQGMQGVVHLFGVVQAHQTSSNLPKPHHYRDSKVCRVFSHEFGVVRLYRTFSMYIVTGETRSAGCLGHMITEIAR